MHLAPLTALLFGRWPMARDSGVCHTLDDLQNAPPVTGYYQIGGMVVNRDNPKQRTLAFTAAIAARAGLMLSSKYPPLIGG